MVEVFVALTLIGTGLSVSASLVVRHSRLVAEQRQYRLALDELANQLEVLAALPNDALPAAVERLEISEFGAARLPDAKLAGEVRTSDVGQQITLSITWDGRAKDAAPLSLSAWVIEQHAASQTAPSERRQP